MWSLNYDGWDMYHFVPCPKWQKGYRAKKIWQKVVNKIALNIWPLIASALWIMAGHEIIQYFGRKQTENEIRTDVSLIKKKRSRPSSCIKFSHLFVQQSLIFCVVNSWILNFRSFYIREIGPCLICIPGNEKVWFRIPSWICFTDLWLLIIASTFQEL